VYDEPHQISQVDSKFHPNGILLNVRGAKSWLEASDVLLCTTQEAVAVAETPTTITAEPQIIVREAAPVVIHDTVTTTKEVIKEVVKEVVKVDTVFQTNTVAEQAKKAAFQLDVAMQAACGKENLGVGAHVTVGGRFSNVVFLGLGVGFEGSIFNLQSTKSVYTFQIPVYANTRCYFPVNGVSPFVDLAAGVNIRELNINYMTNKEWICGLYTRAGIGVEYKRLLVGAGYQFTGGDKTLMDNIHQGYVKIGVRFFNKN